MWNHASHQPPKQDEEDEEADHKIGKCTMKDNPKLLQFYPWMCTVLINLVKFYFWEHQIFNDPFPSMEDSLAGICQDVLYQAMNTFEHDGCMIEAGKFLVASTVVHLQTCSGYWDKHLGDMAHCVWKVLCIVYQRTPGILLMLDGRYSWRDRHPSSSVDWR